MVYYPEKEKISEFSTNADGYLILPEELKAGHYRIEEIQAPDGYVRQGYEEEQTKAIEIVINSDTPHQIDPIQALILWKSYSIMRRRQVILLCKSRRTAKNSQR